MRYQIHFTDENSDQQNQLKPITRLLPYLSERTEFSTLQDVTLIFCSESFIHELNSSHRNIDEPTDVLTFPVVEGQSGEIYISIDTIKSDLQDELGKYSDSRLHEEIIRMIVHGLLHLSGKTHEDKLPYGAESEIDEEMYRIQEWIVHEITSGDNLIA